MARYLCDIVPPSDGLGVLPLCPAIPNGCFEQMVSGSCPIYVGTTCPDADTVYISDGDFMRDFNSMVTSYEMNVFLAAVMAGILSVRAVIKVIKGAVR